jgi:hypothetical protein
MDNTTTAYACERCNAPTRTGITCDDCHIANMRRCLASAAWRRNAATRTGDLPGETMLDTYRRIVCTIQAGKLIAFPRKPLQGA